MEKNIIDAIEEKLGYVFNNKALLVQAFTRESYAKEQRVKGLDIESNEQLEYFGDSVLNYLVVSGELDHFTKTTDNGLRVLYKESKLSEFNSHWTDKNMLSECIDNLGLAEYLIMSKGDINQHAELNKSVREDLFESLVGAMWIDSNKDTNKIKDVVFNMLGIKFETTSVEKSYVSQLIEFADKYKYKLKKDSEPFDGGFKVTFSVDLNFLPTEDKEERTWYGTGVGKNLKEAEANAAKELLNNLNEFGFGPERTDLPKMDFDLDNSVNCLQELSQKGYIGQVTYEDDLCFSTEKKPYWRVTVKISDFITTFDASHESKKTAKKQAAYDALCFIYYLQKNDINNPQNKQFRFLLDADIDEDDIRVFVIDSYSMMKATGTIYPDNKKTTIFMDKYFHDENGHRIEVYNDPQEFLFEWYTRNRNNHPKERRSDNSERLGLFIQEEYNKLDDKVKQNGVLLREALLDIAKRIDI